MDWESNSCSRPSWSSSFLLNHCILAQFVGDVAWKYCPPAFSGEISVSWDWAEPGQQHFRHDSWPKKAEMLQFIFKQEKKVSKILLFVLRGQVHHQNQCFWTERFINRHSWSQAFMEAGVPTQLQQLHNFWSTYQKGTHRIVPTALFTQKW